MNDVLQNGRTAEQKSMAKAIKTRLAELGHEIPLGHAYEALAASLGHKHWSAAAASISTGSSGANGAINVRRWLKADFFLSYGDHLLHGDYGSQRLKPLVQCVALQAGRLFEKGEFDPFKDDFRDLFDIKRVIRLAEGSDDQALRIRYYLKSLPGYEEDRGLKQSRSAIDAHNSKLLDISEAVFAFPVSSYLISKAFPRALSDGCAVDKFGSVRKLDLENITGAELGEVFCSGHRIRHPNVDNYLRLIAAYFVYNRDVLNSSISYHSMATWIDVMSSSGNFPLELKELANTYYSGFAGYKGTLSEPFKLEHSLVLGNVKRMFPKDID